MTNDKKSVENEEIDISILLEKIKNFFLNIVLGIFINIKELVSAWKTLSVIIIFGAIVGGISEKFTETDASKDASVLLRINFDAGNYVYDAINLINQKIEAEDNQFFINEMRFNEGEILEEISIKPIIDLKDILKDEINVNQIKTLFDNLEFEDNLAMTKGFVSDYEYHILSLKMSSFATSSSVGKIIDYFNKNPLFIGLKERQLQSITSTIFNNEQTIKQIDRLIEKHSSSENFEKNTSQLYIDSKTYLPNELIKIKIELEEQNEELKGERILSKETVMAVNNTNLLVQQERLSDNKIIYYPALLVLVFILGGGALKLYKYLEKLEKQTSKN